MGYASVATANTLSANVFHTNGYGNSFIFQEQGIEFSVFPDGQFDFYMLNNHSGVSVSVGNGYSTFSFNTGYNYDAYVQYDEFGAVIQVEHVPIFYDYYGRISRAGNVFISYNNYGFVSRIGGLHVYYNNYHRFSHCSGFINIHNRRYIHRPWHRYYAIPSVNYCVVYSKPYRKHYRPKRYHFNGYYKNNHRRTTAVANRRGNQVRRNSSYATPSRSRSVVARNVKANTNTSVRGSVHRERTVRTRKQVRTPNATYSRGVKRAVGRNNGVASSSKKAVRSYRTSNSSNRQTMRTSKANKGRTR